MSSIPRPGGRNSVRFEFIVITVIVILWRFPSA